MPETALPRYAHAVLISDFLLPLDAVDKALRGWAAMGVRGTLLQVLDPAEEVLPYSGRIRFCGLEEEGELLLPRVEDIQDAYARRLSDHRGALTAIAHAVGWDFTVHHTNSPPQAALIALHTHLSGR